MQMDSIVTLKTSDSLDVRVTPSNLYLVHIMIKKTTYNLEAAPNIQPLITIIHLIGVHYWPTLYMLSSHLARLKIDDKV